MDAMSSCNCLKGSMFTETQVDMFGNKIFINFLSSNRAQRHF